MTATMTNVMAELKRQQQAAELEFDALVESMAGGEKIDAGTVNEVLTDAGKTPGQFEQAVQAKAERLRLKALADGYDTATADLLSARDEVEKLQAELVRVTAKLTADIRVKQQKCHELVQRVAEAKTAGRALLNGYVGDLREQQQQVQRRTELADARLKIHRREVTRLEQQLLAVQARPDDFRHDALGLAQGALDARRRDLAQAVAERDAALAESNRITDLMRQA